MVSFDDYMDHPEECYAKLPTESCLGCANPAVCEITHREHQCILGLDWITCISAYNLCAKIATDFKQEDPGPCPNIEVCYIRHEILETQGLSTLSYYHYMKTQFYEEEKLPLSKVL